MSKTPLQPLTVADLGRRPLDEQVSLALETARQETFGTAHGWGKQLAFSSKACVRALTAYGNLRALARSLQDRIADADAAERRAEAAHGDLSGTRRLIAVQRVRFYAGQLGPMETAESRLYRILLRFLPRVPAGERRAIDGCIHDSLDPEYDADVELAGELELILDPTLFF